MRDVLSTVGIHDEEANVCDRRRGRIHHDQERHHWHTETQGQSNSHGCTRSKKFRPFVNDHFKVLTKQLWCLASKFEGFIRSHIYFLFSHDSLILPPNTRRSEDETRYKNKLLLNSIFHYFPLFFLSIFHCVMCMCNFGEKNKKIQLSLLRVQYQFRLMT